MPVSSLARPVLRSATFRLAGRRFESNAANKAADATKDTVGKAQQGLSRVTSAAGPALAGAAKSVTGTLSKIGGRTGRLFAFVERQTPRVVYYSRVGLELSKIVFHGQKMSPPSVSTFQTYYQNLWRSIQNRTILQSPQNLLQQVRNVNNAQLLAGSVIVAELLGFFTVGEMIGRMKIVGYRGESGAHH